MPKRGAIGSGSPSKRARGPDAGVRAKISLVVDALEDDSLEAEAPMGARRMLADGAPAGLATVVEERHQLQDVIIGHIREVFTDIASRLRAKVAAAKQMSEAQGALVVDETSQLQAASSELESAEAAAEGEREKLVAAQESVRVLESELAQLESSQRQTGKERASVEKEKSKYTSLQDELLKPLLEGGFATEKEAQKAINKLVRDLERIGAESAMLASVPAVLLKKPDERKGFDTMVVESMQDVLSKALEGVDGKIAASDSKTAEMGQEAVAKAEAVEKAKADRDSQAAALEAATAASGEKAKAKQDKEGLLATTNGALEEYRDSVAEAESELATFAGVEEALAALAALSSAPAEPEVPEGASQDAVAPA